MERDILSDRLDLSYKNLLKKQYDIDIVESAKLKSYFI